MRPPAKPAISPSTVPSASAITVLTAPTPTLMRRP